MIGFRIAIGIIYSILLIESIYITYSSHKAHYRFGTLIGVVLIVYCLITLGATVG